MMVHLFTLGALTNSIVVWSQHFTEKFLHQQAPDSARPGQLLKIWLLNLGIIVTVCGQLFSFWPVTTAGAVIVGAAMCWHGVALARQYLAAPKGGQFVTNVLGYVAACIFMLIGVVFGIFNATGHEHIAAHMAAMLLGFTGITALVTLDLLFPTIWRSKASGDIRLSILATSLGTLVTIATSLDGATLIPGIALYALGWLLAMFRWGKMIVKVLADPRDRITFASLAVACAPLWLLIGLVDLARGELPTISLVMGFAAQLLIGVMSFLLPSTIGGGPSAVRAGLYRLDQAGIFRATIFNAGLAVWQLSSNSWLKVIMSLAASLALAWFIPSVAQAVKRQRLVLMKKAEGPQPKTKPAFGQATFALALVALVVALAGGASTSSTPGSAAVAATGTTEVTIAAGHMVFSPNVINVPKGHELKITLKNTDTMLHDLKLANGAESGRIGAGETVSFSAGVITENMDGWCTIAGHKQQGMTLQVVVDDAAAAATDHTTHAEHATTSSDQASQGLFTDPVLAPAPAETTHELSWDMVEVAGPDRSRWLFVPAGEDGTNRALSPTLRGKVGDTFIVHLTNKGSMSHSLDFHAGMVSPDPVMRDLAPGEQLTYRFTATHAGAWMYHCGTAPMSMHVASGMFGAVIIDPPNLTPVDQEYVLVQSEIYQDNDAAAQLKNVVFNGVPDQYLTQPLTLRAGQTARFWLVNAGPNRALSFHIVGTQFERVYKEGAYLLTDTTTGASQALDLLAAQGGFVEARFNEPGTYKLVNHQFSDAEAGARGKIVVQ